VEKDRIINDRHVRLCGFPKGHPGITLSIQQADEISLSPVVLGELLAGFMMGKNERRNRSILRDFLSSARVNLLEIDEETSERYAVILYHLRSKGAPIPTNDVWIAASAMQYGLKVLTTDKHYIEVPQVITEYHPV
jgi:tRNA(fMet)-specific endonuclease VapC